MTTRLGQRHKLVPLSILTLDGKINELCARCSIKGMDRFDARKKIIADLEEQGLLVETKPHKLMVPRGDRTHAVIEPMLTDQWYVAMEGLAKARAGSGSEWRDRIHSGKLESCLQPMARKYPGLVYFASIVVGTPDSGMV